MAIGASGDEGLQNIRALLHAFGPDFLAIVMVVLHRAFERPSLLREVLRAAARMPVYVADDRERLEVGHCYIGEPASHLTSWSTAWADPDKLHRGRTVDLLFRSVAAHAGRCGIGVVLAGALDDGSRGLEAIHHAGGRTMVLLRSP